MVSEYLGGAKAPLALIGSANSRGYTATWSRFDSEHHCNVTANAYVFSILTFERMPIAYWFQPSPKNKLYWHLAPHHDQLSCYLRRNLKQMARIITNEH